MLINLMKPSPLDSSIIVILCTGDIHIDFMMMEMWYLRVKQGG